MPVLRLRSTATRRAYYEGSLAEVRAQVRGFEREIARLGVKARIIEGFIARLEGEKRRDRNRRVKVGA